VQKTFPYDDKVLKKLMDKNPITILENIKKTISEGENDDSIRGKIMAWSKENNIPMGELMQSFRLALVGRLSGPDIFKICSVLGKGLTLKRIEGLIDYIKLKKTI
jgi:glutamyl-tRNA synthetase